VLPLLLLGVAGVVAAAVGLTGTQNLTRAAVALRLPLAYVQSASKWAKRRGLPLDWVLTTILVESGGNPRAAGDSDGRSAGLMQVNTVAHAAELKAAGLEVLENPEHSRKLILTTNQALVRVVLVRASDVPTYVEYGGADLGVTGLDTLIEHGGTGLYQPLDLQIAKCRMSVAVPNGFDYAGVVKQGSRLKVATKYMTIARDFFAQKGVHVDLVKLYGSMELAPLTGLADAIVDLVSSGNTLKANHLIEVEQIMPISSRLVINQAAFKLKQSSIKFLLDAFARAVNEKVKVQ